MAKADAKNRSPVRSAVFIGLKLLLICAIVAGVVAGVNTLTDAKYQENLNYQKSQAIKTIFGENASFEKMDPAPGTTDAVIYEVKEGDTLLGYCVEVVSTGFGGDINLSVGYNPDRSIKRVYIVPPLNETPGIGSKVQENESYLPEQYEGQSGSLTLGEDVDAIAGATITSTAVLEGVNLATQALDAALGGENS